MNDGTDGAGCQSGARSARLTQITRGAASDLPKSTKPPRRHRMQATAQAPLGADLDLVAGRATGAGGSGPSSAPRRATWSSGTTSTPTRSPRSISPRPSFPSGDPTSQLMATAGIFAVGFFMRPLGGWLFGWIADRHGRKNSMVISVLMMCAGSLMIAVLPTYATIGAAGAGAAAGGAAGAGAVGRRRIRHRGDLHERGRRQGQPRLLFLVPVRDADRRAAAGAAGAGGAAGAAVRG